MNGVTETQVGGQAKTSIDSLKTLPGLILTYDKDFMDDLMRSIEYSIKQYGRLLRPVVISKDGYIIDGNATVTAAKRIGLREVETYIVPVMCKGNEAICTLLYHVLNSLRREPQRVDRVSRRRALYSLVLSYLANQAEDEYARLIEKMRSDTVPMELIKYIRNIAPLPYATVYYDLLLFVVHPKLYEGMLQVRDRGVNTILASIPDEVFATPQSEVERLRGIPREDRERSLREELSTKPQPKIARELSRQVQSQQQPEAATTSEVQQPPREGAVIAEQPTQLEQASRSLTDADLTLNVEKVIMERAPNLVRAIRSRLSNKKGIELDLRMIATTARETRNVERIIQNPGKPARGIFIYNMLPIALRADAELDILRRAVLARFLSFMDATITSLIYLAAGPEENTERVKLVLYKLYKSLADPENMFVLKADDVVYSIKLWLGEFAVLLYQEFPELVKAVGQDLEEADRIYRQVRDKTR